MVDFPAFVTSINSVQALSPVEGLREGSHLPVTSTLNEV